MVLSLAAAATWGAGSARGALINVVSSNVVADARDNGTGVYDSELDNQTALNRTNTIEAIAGGSRSTTTLDWSGNDDFALLKFDFDHLRVGDQHSYARTYESVLRFTVSENTTYSLNGNYKLAGDQRIHSRVYLYDETASTYLQFDYSESHNTLNEAFALGVANDGDWSNNTFGSLTGNLVAGHNYVFFFDNFIHAYPAGSTTARAEGFLHLEIGDAPDATVTPEPGSLTIFGLGTLCFALARYRRRRQQPAA